MQKRGMKKRIVSLALTLVMLLSYIPGAVWAVDSTTDIKAIEKPTGISIVEDYDDYVGDNWLEMLGLPAFVTVTLANNSKVEVPVTWDSCKLDTRKTGFYSLPGTITLPEGATNDQNLGVAITVQVREGENLFPNPSFESGKTGWHGATFTEIKDPAHISDGAASLMKTASSSSMHYSFHYQAGQSKDPTKEANYCVMLAEAMNAIGAGQYYFAYDAKSAAATAQGVSFGMEILTKPVYTDGTTTIARSEKFELPLANESFATAGLVFDYNAAAGWIRTDFKIYGAAGALSNVSVYIDNAKLIPLKVALESEPANVESIKTELLSRKVVLNYPDYVGENWKDELGLPKTVEVLTDTGAVVDVPVTWSYAGLDFTKYGKYTLTGKLEESFPNPKGITATINIFVSKPNNLLPNASFEDGVTGWHGSTSVENRDLNFVSDGAMSLLKVTSSTKVSNIFNFQAGQSKEPANNYCVILADAVNAAGPGQYYISYDAKAAAETMANRINFGISILKKTAYTDSTTASVGKGEEVLLPLAKEDFATASMVFDYDGSAGWLRTDFTLYGKAGDLADVNVYIDNAKLFPLNIAIPKDQEPSDVTKILSVIPIRAVIKGYDQYVGENWKEALGLPETVEVLTSVGNTASVGVIWNYDNLNLNEEGKYTLVGTLDNSAYPNPDELFVTQVIRIRDYKNVMPNPSMENTLETWYIRGANPSAATVKGVSKLGAYSAITGAMVSSKNSINFANNKEFTDVVASAITMQGAGQYYMSAWAMQASDKTVPGMQFELRFAYKTMDANGELSKELVKKAPMVAMDNKNFVQSAGIIELPEGIASAQMNLYAHAQTPEDINNTKLYFDYAELVPLNVAVEQYDGHMLQVESLIPDRQIVQNFHEYIGEGYTTDDLMVPETVKVKTSTGEVVNIEVKWDFSKLDLTKIGTYTIHGVLDDLKLENPKALTVKQNLKVVARKNIFTNPSFEQDGSGWKKRSDATIETGITNPVRTGSFSLKFMSGRMDDWTNSYLQSFYNNNPVTEGQKVTQTGAGLYHYSGWAQGTASTNDIEVQLRMLYRSMANGDSAITTRSATVKLSTSKFTQMGGFVTMPGDVYWARMDFYLLGTPAQMRLSEVYLDDFELIPLNVEIPNMTDIIDCEDAADIYVHEGSSIEGLDLPKDLRVVVKNGQKFNMKVNWNTASFDPNKIGEQTITGSLDLGKTYKNPKEFTPTVKIIVRAKGEDLRQTIYLSTSGSEDNDGLTPEKPKQDVTKIVTYLQQGYNVKLKRGDNWYLPTYCYSFNNIHATKNAPQVLGVYGSGDAKAGIFFMRKIENSEWKLVDEKRNVYAVNVAELGQQFGYSVHRCYVDGQSFFVKERNTYVALKAGEFCSYDNTLYVRMPDGEAPRNVEVTPFNVGNRVYMEQVSNLTVEHIHFKGTGAINSLIRVQAPTENLKFLHCNMTHLYNHVMRWDADDDQYHDHPEIAHCYMDNSLSEADGAIREGYWKTSSTEGVTICHGVDAMWFHHNRMIGFSHAGISVESADAGESYEVTGVRNCIFEDNVLEGGYALYARGITLSAAFNLAGVQMCRDNIVRRNYFYDMTTAGHFFGENNIIYSNVISYVHCNYTEEGELFDGKNAQPFAFDTKVYGGKNSVGNMLINNTFYNLGGALLIEDIAGGVYNNIYANNLIVNWTSDPAANGRHGAISDNSILMQYVMNNGVYSTIGMVDPFVVDGNIYSAAEVNNAVAGYSGNISADPMFVNADLTQMQHGARLDFTLSAESPMRYAGLSAYDNVYKTFPAWERMMADYTDINGVAYLAESPSIGAYSFSERIAGDVAEVSKLDDIVARPGATFQQLNLPRSVRAKNDQGVEVVLLTTWSDVGFDSSKPGTITLTAQLRNGPHTNLTIGDAVATINVNITDKMALLNVTTLLKDLTVFYGTSFEDVLKQLPAELEVQEESGFNGTLPVTWACDNYNPTKPDGYTFTCILPADKVTNAKDFTLEVEVRVLHEIGRGMELLINPDFIDGTSAAPWTMGWGTGTIKVTTDPEYLYPGEPASMIVTADGRYGSLQQNVLGQLQLMGDGKYLFKMYMRAYDPGRPIESSVPTLKVFTPLTYNEFCRTKTNIGTDWVEFSAVMNVYDVDEATEIIFHTSTYKTDNDVKDDPKSYVISGCSLIYLGKTDAEVEATLDSIDLVWNAIKGENGLNMTNVVSDLKLPSRIGMGSEIKWSSSDESAITNDGKVILGRVPKTVTMTATITYNGIETIKKFTVTVPRNPDLPTFTGTLTGTKDAVKVGDEFKVTISLSSDKATTFNGYRFTVSFNASKLEYVGISDPTATVDVNGGRVTISGIGTESPITDTITVTFKALKSGITEVKLVKVEVESNPNVTLETLPTMTVENGTFVVDVQKISGADNEAADTAENDNSVVIWIVIGLIAAALIAGGVIVIILIKKKKQLPPATEE